MSSAGLKSVVLRGYHRLTGRTAPKRERVVILGSGESLLQQNLLAAEPEPPVLTAKPPNRLGRLCLRPEPRPRQVRAGRRLAALVFRLHPPARVDIGRHPRVPRHARVHKEARRRPVPPGLGRRRQLPAQGRPRRGELRGRPVQVDAAAAAVASRCDERRRAGQCPQEGAGHRGRI